MDRSWFHWQGGLFFRRGEQGSVEIGQGPDFDSVEILHTIDAFSWISIVSSVSACGENHITYSEALDFHVKE